MLFFEKLVVSFVHCSFFVETVVKVARKRSKLKFKECLTSFFLLVVRIGGMCGVEKMNTRTEEG